MAFRKLKGSFKNRDITTHVIEDTYLAHDTVTGQLRIGDGVTPGGTLVTTGGGGSADLGDLQIVGSKISVQDSSAVGVGIENIRIAGNTFTIDDSAVGFEFDGHLIPASNDTYDLGSPTRRWKTAFLSSETIDIGGATISSDGTGAIAISATGATLPEDSKVENNKIQIVGATSGTGARPVQKVKIFVSDGSTQFTDAELLAQTAPLTLEFNATIDTEPVYTQAQQTFTLSDGPNIASQDTVTLFQF